jgi:hypothetical protein
MFIKAGGVATWDEISKSFHSVCPFHAVGGLDKRA